MYSAEVAAAVDVALPYGTYSMTFKGGLFEPAQRQIVLEQPRLTVSLPVTRERYMLDVRVDPVSVSFRFLGTDSCVNQGSLFAKLIGVFSGAQFEQRVAPGGFALFEPVEIGAYVIVVTAGPEVRAVSTLVTNGPLTSMTIKLAPCKKE